VDLLLDLDAPSGRRAALERAVRDAIRTGRLAVGARLPSSRALAAELGVARGTVVEAYAQLAAEGWLETAPRAATTVAAVPPQPLGALWRRRAATAGRPRSTSGPARPM
jgi:GntR family transcriptional regulator / MocR family aminotransferase